jgi:hypothetical protein
LIPRWRTHHCKNLAGGPRGLILFVRSSFSRSQRSMLCSASETAMAMVLGSWRLQATERIVRSEPQRILSSRGVEAMSYTYIASVEQYAALRMIDRAEVEWQEGGG